MKRFSFRLDAITRLAAADANIRRIELAACEERLREAIDRADSHERSAEASRAALQSLVERAGVSPREISDAIRRMDDARCMAVKARDAELTFRNAADDARRRFEEQLRRRKVLVRLEQRARYAHARERERVVQHEMDEIATQRLDEDRA